MGDGSKGRARIVTQCLAHVVDLEAIPLAEPAPDLRFRVEVWEKVDSGPSYFAKVFRYEMFRIQPTFPQNEGEPALETADEELLVADETFDWQSIRGASPQQVIEGVIAYLRSVLGD